jgi:hypothetical protein
MSVLWLPAEVLDHIVDDLRNNKSALKACCLVSKSWIPRARKHLFACITLPEHFIGPQTWINTFRDPSTSPARHYTKHLCVRCPHRVTAAAEEGSWIRESFRQVEHLEMHVPEPDFWVPTRASLVPFHGFSPALKTLSVTGDKLPAIFHLACSFPRLENLALWSPGFDEYNDSLWTPIASSTPPFTGFLKLTAPGGINATVSQLLSLPFGPHFRRMELSWGSTKDPASTTVLVERCCSTLESLSINSYTGVLALHLPSN